MSVLEKKENFVTEMCIRDVCADDAEALVGILNPIIAAGRYTALDTPMTIEAERVFIEEFAAKGIFHVADEGPAGTVVGFQTVEPFATYTHAFDHVGVIATFVDLTQRRRGISTRLFNTTFEVAIRKGYEKLFTFVRADNRAALAAYERQGFGVVGMAQKHAKFGDRYVDEIMIEKFL